MDQQNVNPKLALIEKLQESKNILVTVSSNPSVDQLAACIGLTLWLNRAEKHATAVFSGDVPSTLEFLQPEETLEKNTDSLRDFIISLDKSKADKLRYKVEENVVKIFITPYRTSLSADDLEYSQGDFNVDTIIALGVASQNDLDTAITSHGRILHDATVVTITTGDAPTELGSIQWHDPHASSLSELVVDLGNGLDQTKLDNQIATALLTGIVAQTDRFSNDKTTPQTMSVSAELMSAGANQQLVVSKLEEPAPEPVEEPVSEPTVETDQPPAPSDGSLEIEHEDAEQAEHEAEEPTENSEAEAVEEPVEEEQASLPVPAEPVEEAPVEESQPDQAVEEPSPQDETSETTNEEVQEVTPEIESHHRLEEPTQQDDEANDLDSDVFGHHDDSHDTPLLQHTHLGTSSAEPEPLQPAPPSWMPEQSWMSEQEQPFTPAPDETLSQIEHEVDSPHVAEAEAAQEAARPDLDDARDEVLKALQDSSEAPLEPVQALNAQPIELHPPVADAEQPVPTAEAPSTAFDPGSFGIANDPDATPVVAPEPAPFVDPNLPADPELTTPVEQPYTLPLPPTMTQPPLNTVPPTSVENDPSAPPPVPPPLPFVPGQQ